MKQVSKLAIATITVVALVFAGANPALADTKPTKPKDKTVSEVVKKSKKATKAKKAITKKKSAKKKSKAVATKPKAKAKVTKTAKSQKRKITTVVVEGAPTIDSLSVSSGAPGDEVTISGANLLDFASVDFGGVVADVVYPNEDNSITAVIPEGASSGPITVTLNDGQTVSSADFTVTPLVDPSPTCDPAVDFCDPIIDPSPTEEPTVEPSPTEEPTIEPSPTEEPTANPWDDYQAALRQASVDLQDTLNAAQLEFDTATAGAKAQLNAALASATTFKDVYSAYKAYNSAVAVQAAELQASQTAAYQAYSYIVSKASEAYWAAIANGYNQCGVYGGYEKYGKHGKYGKEKGKKHHKYKRFADCALPIVVICQDRIHIDPPIPAPPAFQGAGYRGHHGWDGDDD